MAGIQVRECDNYFEVEFPFHPAILSAVKSMLGARWIASDKVWRVPMNQRPAIEQFKQRYRITSTDNRPEVIGESAPLQDLLPDQMDILLAKLRQPDGKKPFPYQLKGAATGVQYKKFINGDAPGLGKTLQTIMTLMLAGPDAFPALIICPASLKYNWQREWMLWTGKQAVIMTDSIKKSWKEYIRVGAGSIFICNYESLKKYFVAEIRKPDPKTPLRLNHIHFDEGINAFKSVVIDESHRVKDIKTQQCKFTAGISKGKDYIIALTGTPVVNKPRDLISQLGIIGQAHHFGNYKGFLNRYCEGYNGASNLKELNYLLTKHCFYRREKKDVLKELPDKMRQIVLCDINTRQEYNHALADLENYLRNYKNANDDKVRSALRGELMVRIGILKNISARGKLGDVIDQVREITEQGEKIVVFVHLREVAAALKKAFPDALTVLGEDPTAVRDINIASFQSNPEKKVIICSIKAAGVGITLTAASRVAFVEQPWHPADCEQCEDRCHRIGQHDSVQCIYFLGKDTIDEHIYKIINDKRAMVNQITGATEDVQSEVLDLIAGSLFNSRKGVAV